MLLFGSCKLENENAGRQGLSLWSTEPFTVWAATVNMQAYEKPTGAAYTLLGPQLGSEVL
jgi:hypothetical protein